MPLAASTSSALGGFTQAGYVTAPAGRLMQSTAAVARIAHASAWARTRAAVWRGRGSFDGSSDRKVFTMLVPDGPDLKREIVFIENASIPAEGHGGRWATSLAIAPTNDYSATIRCSARQNRGEPFDKGRIAAKWVGHAAG
jgi:hypothetical protein